MREEFFKIVINYKKLYKNIMVLDADCSTSTKSRLFQEIYPTDFLNVGIAEQNLVGVSAGLSLRGKIPIVNAFSKMLIMRAFEQLHDLVELQNIKMILIGHYAGLSAGLEGATHHSVNDISLIRNIKNMNILTPGNVYDLKQCIDFSINSSQASYIRLSKNEIHLPFSNNLIELSGMNKESISYYYPGKKIIIITIGVTYSEAIKTSKWFEMKRINHTIISIWNYGLIDYKEILKIINKEDIIIIIDEHKKFGSIGSEINEKLTTFGVQNKIKLLCINDNIITDTGKYEYLIKKYKVDSFAIKNIVINEGW